MTGVPSGFLLDHHGRETLDIDNDVAALTAIGMTLIRWGRHVATGKRIALLHDGVASKIELMEVDGLTGRLDHIAFAVDDLVNAQGKALSGAFTEELPPFRIEAAGAWSSFVRSASGTLIQLIRYDHDSPDRAPWNSLPTVSRSR